ncbi:MAG: IS200/IS605 family transposase [Armatimonadetes bacterium]|nr:IS200/IS605 family transposase [Armatimonadota bacterium]
MLDSLDAFSLLYVHIVWTTWQRTPWLTTEPRSAAYACMTATCDTLNCTVIALDGTDDHVHLLIHIPPTLDVSALVKRLKGASSHLINQQALCPVRFQWQKGYGGFTVSPWDVDKVKDYIHSQEEHHRNQTLKPILERTPADPDSSVPEGLRIIPAREFIRRGLLAPANSLAGLALAGRSFAFAGPSGIRRALCGLTRPAFGDRLKRPHYASPMPASTRR